MLKVQRSNNEPERMRVMCSRLKGQQIINQIEDSGKVQRQNITNHSDQDMTNHIDL